MCRMCKTKKLKPLMRKILKSKSFPQSKATWYIYLLECQDGSFYTGITNNLDKRMKTHIQGKGSKYVRSKKFKKLLHTKQCKSRVEAQKVEHHIKTLHKWDKLDWFN